MKQRIPNLLILLSSILAIFLIVWILGVFFTREKVLKVGIGRWISSTEYDRNISAFKAKLSEKGYIEGKNIVYLVRNPEAKKEEQEKIAEEFEKDEVDLIYSLTTPGTLVFHSKITQIPIVFSIVTYPVEVKLIHSLHKSENNLVGTRNYIPAKRQLAVFRKIAPAARVIGFVHRSGEPNSEIQLKEFKTAVAGTSIKIINLASRDLNDIRQQLTTIKGKVGALYSACDTLIQGGGEEIVIAFARKHRLPDFTCNRSGVEKGSLIGNVVDFATLGQMAGEKAALILKGARPTNLPTEWPMEDNILINLKSAEELGLLISEELIWSASEVFR